MKPLKKSVRAKHARQLSTPIKKFVRGKPERQLSTPDSTPERQLSTSDKLDREINEVLSSPRKRQGPRGKVAPSAKSSVRPPTSTSDVRSPTSTSTEVRSPTSTSTEVRSPTSTSTDAYTSGNVTVTGGAGDGATTSVKIYASPKSGKDPRRADTRSNEYRSRGSQQRMTDMIEATMAPRTPAPMPAIMRSTGDRKHAKPKEHSDDGLSREPTAVYVPKKALGSVKQRSSTYVPKKALSPMKSRSSERDLNAWLDRHGYHHAHARKQVR